MYSFTSLIDSNNKWVCLFPKFFLSLIILFSSIYSTTQETGVLIFENNTTHKAYIVERGGKVKVKYKDPLGEDSKLIGKVSRVTADSIHLKSGKKVCINDIQSIRLMSKKSYRLFITVLLILMGIGLVAATVLVMQSISPTSYSSILEIFTVAMLYTPILLSVLSIFYVFPSKHLKNVQDDYKIAFYSENTGVSVGVGGEKP